VHEFLNCWLAESSGDRRGSSFTAWRNFVLNGSSPVAGFSWRGKVRIRQFIAAVTGLALMGLAFMGALAPAHAEQTSFHLCFFIK
jgi:hypothetical protein